MTEKLDNPSAFPNTPGTHWSKGGMTLRDYIAAQAVPALIARHRADVPWTDIPRIALDIADAFLVARAALEKDTADE